MLSISSTLHNAAETTRRHDSWLLLREVIGNVSMEIQNTFEFMLQVSGHIHNAQIQKLLLYCLELPKLEIQSDYKSIHCSNAV